MADEGGRSIDEMLAMGGDELMKGLAYLQETQREVKILFYSTSNDDSFDNQGKDWSDSVEYEFMRGLRKVPESLLPYLGKGGKNRACLLEAARCLIGNAPLVAEEILETRGPFTTREESCPPAGEDAKHNFPGGTHRHYTKGEPPKIAINQVLKDTAQSLKDYAESIMHIR